MGGKVRKGQKSVYVVCEWHPIKKVKSDQIKSRLNTKVTKNKNVCVFTFTLYFQDIVQSVLIYSSKR